MPELPPLARINLYEVGCAHCGAQSPALIDTLPGGEVVCRPADPEMTDCYRRITVYSEELGILKSVDIRPAGITWIIRHSHAPACIRCDKLMWDSAPADLNHPIPATSKGTNFTSRGNYGSTLWDPMGMEPAYLFAVICDDCLLILREAGQILHVTPPPPDTRRPEVRLWREGD